jgi:hypothetical protein
VQRHPDRSLEVLRQLDEVIAAAQGAEGQHPLLVVLVRRRARLSCQLHQSVDAGGRCRSQFPVVLARAHRDASLDAGPDRCGVTDVGSLQRGPDRDHAAADIDAHRCGNDGAFGWQYGTDRRATAVMTIRHHGDVPVYERHRRRVEDLALGLALYGVPGEEHHRLVVDPLHADDGRLDAASTATLLLRLHLHAVWRVEFFDAGLREGVLLGDGAVADALLVAVGIDVVRL